MPLNIKDARTHNLARALAAETGETITEAVRAAVEERLERVRRRRQAQATRLADQLDEIARRCAARPIRDERTPDEILGYDKRGLPT